MLLSLYPLARQTGIILLIYLGFMLVERLYRAEAGQPIAHVRFNLLYTLTYQVATFILLPITTTLVIHDLVARLGGPLLRAQSWIDGTLGANARGVLWIATFDLFYYSFHRLQHAWPLLWRQHRLHHLDESLNVTTTLRHHWLEEPLRVVFIVAPMTILFDLQPYYAGVLGFALLIWGSFIHANIRLSLGALGHLIVGPQSHRLHHSIDPRHRDKNFAAFFSFWDRLGGTYCSPNQREFPKTGVVGELAPKSIILANLLPFLDARNRRPAQVDPKVQISP